MESRRWLLSAGQLARRGLVVAFLLAGVSCGGHATTPSSPGGIGGGSGGSVGSGGVGGGGRGGTTGGTTGNAGTGGGAAGTTGGTTGNAGTGGRRAGTSGDGCGATGATGGTTGNAGTGGGAAGTTGGTTGNAGTGGGAAGTTGAGGGAAGATGAGGGAAGTTGAGGGAAGATGGTGAAGKAGMGGAGGGAGGRAGTTGTGTGGAGGGRCASLQLGATRQTRDAILVDLDGDGRIDIVTAESDGHNAVFRQTGPRSFADPDVYGVSNLYMDAVAAADLNGDGVLDLVSPDSYGRIGLLLSGTGGALIPSVISGAAQVILQDVAIADFDGDGHLDMAVAVYETGRLGILWGTGGGGFLTRIDLPSCTGPERVQIIDANEDHLPDLVVGCYGGTSGGPSQIFINNGARSFATSSFYSVFNVAAMATGDVNHDGHADIVFVDGKFKQVIVELGDGHGQFSQPTGLIPTTTASPMSAALGDFDHDGNVDLMVGHVSDPRVFFHHGTGDGHFQAGQAISVPWTAINIAAGDIDGDGIDDFVVTDWGQGLTVFFGPCP